MKASSSVVEEDSSQSKLVADRYLKRELLGEGTYGVVFKAIDTKVFFLFGLSTSRLFRFEYY